MPAGQSQKEITVNEALLGADILLHTAIEAVIATPPATPLAGQCWLVGTGATGNFTGRTDHIAAWSDGGWRYVPPREGMKVYDLAASAHRLFAGSTWRLVTSPAGPTGGSVIDSQARTAIIAILDALRNAGVLT
jgi:hypothetical protein